MKVYELIEALRKMPQDARITIYAGYDIGCGICYKGVDSVNSIGEIYRQMLAVAPAYKED